MDPQTCLYFANEVSQPGRCVFLSRIESVMIILTAKRYVIECNDLQFVCNLSRAVWQKSQVAFFSRCGHNSRLSEELAILPMRR